MDETFEYESNPTGPSNVTIDGGDGNDTIDILWHAEPTSSSGSRVITQFTENEDGTFTAVYSNNYGDDSDLLTVTNVENIRIDLTNRYFFGTQTYPVACHDQIRTGRGNDFVSTSIGDDLVDVGLGDDEAHGGDGTDGISKDLSDRAGNIVWNLQTDSYAGPGSFSDFEWFVDLRTGSGNDVIVSTNTMGAGNAVGDDTISSGAGNDIVSLFNGQDVADLGAGSDRLVLDYRASTFTGNAAMTLSGSFGAGYSGSYIGTHSDAPTVSFAGVEHFTIHTNVSGGNGTNLVDDIITGNGDDSVFTYISDDRIRVGRGIDTVDGGVGNDGLAKDFSGTGGHIAIDLTANTYSGPGGITGVEYFIELITVGGDDTIVTTNVSGSGNAIGDDDISTGGGNDTVTLFNGQDVVDLGAGSNRLTLDYRSSVFTGNGGMTLSGSLETGYAGSYAGTYSNAPTVDFTGVEHFTIYTNVSGGNGSNLVDDIVTGDGDDTVFTYISNDRISVGRGIDTVDGGVGNDGLAKDFTGTVGDIAIDLGAGTLSVEGGITGIEYFIELITTGGDDTIVTTAASGSNSVGSDTISTGAGTDSVTLFHGDDIIDMGAGSDRLILDYRSGSFTGNASLTVTGSLAAGYSGAYTGSYSLAPSASFSGVEHFTIMTNVSGGNGSNLVDNIVTGDGDDIIWTFMSNDVVDAGGGDDHIDGGVGADTLRGGAGNDTILGGTGNDMLFDSGGSDTVDGGEGVDHFTYADATGRVVVSLANTGAQNTRGSGVDTLAGIEILDGSAFGDRIEGDALANTLNGLDGNDNLLGGDGNDVLTGALGNDRLTGGGGIDSLRGGAGNDVYYLDDPGDAGDTIVENASEGTDTVWASIDYTLGSNLENLQLRYGDVRGTGNSVDNTIRASGGNNLIQGLAGNDTIYGGSGRDTLEGGAGADRLVGGVGRDLLSGGSGADRFIFDAANELGSRAGDSDIITDFSRSDGDRINLADIDAIGGTAGNDSFAFIGTEAFSGTAGELRYSFAEGRTLIEVDTDGDSVADLFLRLDGELDLIGRDFIF